jgi:hypothetical protein
MSLEFRSVVEADIQPSLIVTDEFIPAARATPDNSELDAVKKSYH